MAGLKRKLLLFQQQYTQVWKARDRGILGLVAFVTGTLILLMLVVFGGAVLIVWRALWPVTRPVGRWLNNVAVPRARRAAEASAVRPPWRAWKFPRAVRAASWGLPAFGWTWMLAMLIAAGHLLSLNTVFVAFCGARAWQACWGARKRRGVSMRFAWTLRGSRRDRWRGYW